MPMDEKVRRDHQEGGDYAFCLMVLKKNDAEGINRTEGAGGDKKFNFICRWMITRHEYEAVMNLYID
ncbi:hypothetical protein YPC_3659 [Yersinia pestis biovar Medievalis str. Harbin 35]|nr:hypothetical protein YPC_3659 [Yersinia pestis biovar Medievalis str. Harbin 35]